jgi:hypothetical protein
VSEEKRKEPEDMTLEELRARWPLTLSEKNRRGILAPEERERFERLQKMGDTKPF